MAVPVNCGCVFCRPVIEPKLLDAIEGQAAIEQAMENIVLKFRGSTATAKERDRLGAEVLGAMRRLEELGVVEPEGDVQVDVRPHPNDPSRFLVDVTDEAARRERHERLERADEAWANEAQSPRHNQEERLLADLREQGEWLEALGDSGERWAEAFMQLQGGATPDHDLMRAWFANAIEASSDLRLRELRARVKELEGLLAQRVEVTITEIDVPVHLEEERALPRGNRCVVFVEPSRHDWERLVAGARPWWNWSALEEAFIGIDHAAREVPLDILRVEPADGPWAGLSLTPQMRAALHHAIVSAIEESQTLDGTDAEMAQAIARVLPDLVPPEQPSLNHTWARALEESQVSAVAIAPPARPRRVRIVCQSQVDPDE